MTNIINAMEIDEIKNKMKQGDLDTAAQMVGITSNNATQVLKRPKSKHYKALLKALEEVIIFREILIMSATSKKSKEDK